MLVVPVVGVEPTRVISTRDFESPSSAIPTHRLIVYVIIAYLTAKIKRKVCAFLYFICSGASKADSGRISGLFVGRPGRTAAFAKAGGFYPDAPFWAAWHGREGPFCFCPGKAAGCGGGPPFISPLRAQRSRQSCRSGLHARAPAIYPVISGGDRASFFKKDFTNEPQLYII